MNYEVQCKWDALKDWVSWASAKQLGRARAHMRAVKYLHPDRKFRLVRVTRKVVNG